jgi:hypothetical protein
MSAASTRAGPSSGASAPLTAAGGVTSPCSLSTRTYARNQHHRKSTKVESAPLIQPPTTQHPLVPLNFPTRRMPPPEPRSALPTRRYPQPNLHRPEQTGPPPQRSPVTPEASTSLRGDRSMASQNSVRALRTRRLASLDSVSPELRIGQAVGAMQRASRLRWASTDPQTPMPQSRSTECYCPQRCCAVPDAAIAVMFSGRADAQQQRQWQAQTASSPLVQRRDC